MSPKYNPKCPTNDMPSFDNVLASDSRQAIACTNCGVVYWRIRLQVPGSFFESKELTRRCVDLSLKDLQVDYIDMYLIHCPVGLKVRFTTKCHVQQKIMN